MLTREIEIYADTKGKARCRGLHCGATITWAEVVKTGRRMCFTGDPVPLRSRHSESGGRLIEAMDLADNHWGACPDSQQFKRGTK